jgi:hypothetical protein
MNKYYKNNLLYKTWADWPGVYTRARARTHTVFKMQKEEDEEQWKKAKCLQNRYGNKVFPGLN